jgi:cytochrome c biogenesis protein CcdA
MMSDTDRATATIRPGGMIRALLTIGTVTLVAVAGYGGFRFAVRLDLGTEAGAGLVALAVITGFAVFFSPCSFPLVVTMLAGPNRAAKAAQRRRESLTAAVAMGAGASLFLLAVGIIVGVTGEALVQSVEFSTTPGRILRGTVASVIVAAGLIQLGVLRFPFWRVTRFAQPIERHRVKLSGQHQHAAQAFYGFGFVLAGFG